MIYVKSSCNSEKVGQCFMPSAAKSAESTHTHKRFPERLGFLLYNPIRRRFSPPTQLLSRLGVRDDDVVVDFGCGPGFYTIPLARIAARTIGIDISAGMLQRLRENCEKNAVRVELMQSDGRSINLGEDSIDLILLVHVFHEIGQKAEVLSEFSRILKVSGRLAIVERTKSGGFLAGKFGPPVIDQATVVNSIAGGGFRLIELVCDGQDSVIIAGKI